LLRNLAYVTFFLSIIVKTISLFSVNAAFHVFAVQRFMAGKSQLELLRRFFVKILAAEENPFLGCLGCHEVLSHLWPSGLTN